jgi:hypothetical protein
MYFTGKEKYRLKVKAWKNTIQANGAQKQAGIVIFISDK